MGKPPIAQATIDAYDEYTHPALDDARKEYAASVQSSAVPARSPPGAAGQESQPLP